MFASKSLAKGWDFANAWKTIRANDTARRWTRPGPTYSKRSMKLAQLRADSASLGTSGFSETCPPTHATMRSAEAFINGLWEGCLDFDLEISYDGEVNFLYGNNSELFHIHIDEDGVLSYYAKSAQGEKFGDDLSAANFPNRDLLSFVDRNK